MFWNVFLPTVIWVALVVVGFVAHGCRGLWLLIGAPIALLWPYQFTKPYIQCLLTAVPALPSWCPGWPLH
jgi:hypothetical protein